MTDFIPEAPVAPDSVRWRPVFRGYPEGFDVLTENGWVAFESLIGYPGSGVELTSPAGASLLGGNVPFVPVQREVPSYGVNDVLWERFRTGEGFPRVATVDPVSGGVFFVVPEMVVRGVYDQRLIWFKLRGVDFMCSLFTDLWLKGRYGRGWGFVLADDVVRNKYGSAKYFLLNKFARSEQFITPGGLTVDGKMEGAKHYTRSPGSGATGSVGSVGSVGDSQVREHSYNTDFEDMYGDWSPVPYLGGEVELLGVGGRTFTGLQSRLKGLVGSPITVVPKKHVSRERVWNHYHVESLDSSGRVVRADVRRGEVGLFNLVIPPYHNLVIRKTKRSVNPREAWVGSPVVVGDALDKSELRVEQVRGLSAGGSYSPFRPDWRSINAGMVKDK